MERTADVAIIGGGIAGLAHAYMCLKRGFTVVLFERDDFPVGASIRNFGLIWPVGQESGEDLSTALRSRAVWQELSQEAGFWLNDNGCLHLAYHDDEWEVLGEFFNGAAQRGYDCELLGPAEVLKRSPHVRRAGLRGALFSRTESTVYSREAVQAIIRYLRRRDGMTLLTGSAVVSVDVPYIETARGRWRADRVVVCSGADFETLYPDVFAENGMRKCKLQMMRARSAAPAAIGPSLCAGLTLTHYKSFAQCPSLTAVRRRYEETEPRFRENGIHVLVSQNSAGDLIIGDSHHYGNTFEPFESEEVNRLILDYLASFLPLGDLEIVERWHGVYPTCAGRTVLIVEPAPGVTVVNGFGGAGMTLSFGVAERVVKAL